MDFNSPEFEDVLNAKISNLTGEMYLPTINYKNGEPVSTWKETGWTFIPVFITDGVFVREKQSLQFATKETADKIAAFYVEKVVPVGWKVEAKERIGDDEIFWAIDRRTGQKVHMWQVHITTPEGKKLLPVNPGIDANQIARAGKEWAAILFKDAIQRTVNEAV